MTHRGLFPVCLVSSGGPTRAKRTISEQRSRRDIRVLSEQPDASHEKVCSIMDKLALIEHTIIGVMYDAFSFFSTVRFPSNVQ
jgi:hypothetical protein